MIRFIEITTVIFYAITYTLFFLSCSFFFQRYIFEKNNIFLPVLTAAYIMVVPITYSVFSVGSITILFKVYLNSVPLSPLIPAFCLVGIIILAFEPINLVIQSKQLIYSVYISSIISLILGIYIMSSNPWWNQQLAQNVYRNFPSIGLMMIVGNSFVILAATARLIVKSIKAS